MSKNNTRSQVECLSGGILQIDTSDLKCAEFGFTTGEKVSYPGAGAGIVAGVAPATGVQNSDSPNVLWVVFANDNGRASYCGDLAKLSKI